jgi:hypothetical protein
MKLLLDNLFFLGEVISMAGLVWGAWLVLHDSLVGTVFSSRHKSMPGEVIVACLAYPFRKLARVRA